MKKSILYLMLAAFLAVGLIGCKDEEEPTKNYYTIDGDEYVIDSTMFWYQSGMGGDPYIRLITPVDGQEYPDLFKLYPNMGLNELAGTYTWKAKPSMGSGEAGTYDVGYTAGYNGMAYDWTAIGKTGSSDLVITEQDGEYHVTGTFVLSVGTYDYDTGDFIETSTIDMTLDYTGPITEL